MIRYELSLRKETVKRLMTVTGDQAALGEEGAHLEETTEIIGGEVHQDATQEQVGAC